MLNGNGGHPKTWVEVAAMALTLLYRLAALWMFKELFANQREMLDALDRISRVSGLST